MASTGDGFTRSIDSSQDFFDEFRAPSAFIRGVVLPPTHCGHPLCGAQAVNEGGAADKNAPPLMLCTGCRGVVYCSKECQQAHWKLAGAACHKNVCKEQNFQRSAKILVRLVTAREVEALEELCKSGINLVFNDTNGASNFIFPLAIACVPAEALGGVMLKNRTPARQVATINTLVKYGADVNQRVHPGNGTSALHIACQNLQVEAVLRLLQCPNIDVNLRKTSSGCSPIFLATGMHSHLESGPHPQQEKCFVIMKALLDAGAEPNMHGHDIKCLGTPLMYAAAGRNPKLVKLLLERGAHPSVVDEEGRDAFAFAQGDGPTEKAITNFLATRQQQSYVVNKLTPGL